MRTEQVRTEHGISQIMCENNSWREKKIPTENLIIPPFPKILIQHAFETIDTDQSGTVDNKELYAGLLLPLPSFKISHLPRFSGLPARSSRIRGGNLSVVGIERHGGSERDTRLVGVRDCGRGCFCSWGWCCWLCRLWHGDFWMWERWFLSTRWIMWMWMWRYGGRRGRFGSGAML